MVFMVVLLMTLTLLDELTLLPVEQHRNFILLKGSSILITLIAGVMLQRSKTEIDFWANLVLVVGFNAYSLTSALFRPWYLISVMQFALLFAYLVPHTARFFWIYTLSSFTLYMASFVYRWPNVIENEQQLALSDWNNVGVQFFLMAALVYIFFVRSTRYREKSQLQFISIGTHASRIMTDLNALSNRPRFELKEVERLLGQAEQSPLSEIVALTQSQLGVVQKAMLELSSLTSPVVKDLAKFSVRERLESLATTFAPEGKSKTLFLIEGDLLLETDRALVNSLLFNLCSNSFHAFEERQIENPVLRWSLDVDNHAIVFEDNAGGFHPEALKALQREQPYSGFKNGSGLGYQLIRDTVKTLGGKLTLENASGGVRVTWVLPRKLSSGAA
jgi:two-component sensor histidine kinase